MATFYWKMKPHSLKVLGNHIESIPIPSVSLKEQREIVCLVEDILIEKCFPGRRRRNKQTDLSAVQVKR